MVKMMNDIKLVRKELTKLLLVQWSKFAAVPIKIHRSTLFAGINGSGKSTILDAMAYVYTGNTQFNKAAQDRDRTVLSYVRGDTKSQGNDQFLRTGNVVSYVAMEFFSPADNFYITVGVCIESADEQSYKPYWFSKTNARIDDFNFYKLDGKILTVTPKNELRVKGEKMKASDFVDKKKGTASIHRLLGLRCDNEELRRKLMKMMSFQLENNIDKFIRDSVLPEEEIKTIDNLKEQKTQFEKIKETYSNIINRQAILDDIEHKTKIYEKKQNELDLKRAVMYYQNLVLSRKSLADSQKLLSEEKEKQQRLLKQKQELSQSYDTADKAKQAAYHDYRNNDLTAGIENLKITISDQEAKIKSCEDKIKKITSIKNSIKTVSDICELDYDTAKLIENFDDPQYNSDGKYEAFYSVNQVISNKIIEFQKKYWISEQKKTELDENISVVSEVIKQLESNNKDFPKEIKKAKYIINKELKDKGIKAEVRILAELVESIDMPEWRDALEVYLKNHKFDLIIDSEYVSDAMKIFHRHKFKRAQLVFTDKLEDFKANKNSAASILTVPNKEARKYVNYLLGKIYLCNTLEELHDHPAGGLMTDGTLAKGYNMKSMDMSRIDYYLGRDAIKLQLEVKKKELADLKEKSSDTDRDLKLNRECVSKLKCADLTNISLEFEAVNELPDLKKCCAENKDHLTAMENDPTMLALRAAYDKAVSEFERIKNERDRIIDLQGACRKQIAEYEKHVENNKLHSDESQSAFDNYIIMHLELKKLVVSEYERISENKADGIAIRQKTIDNTEGELKKALRDMENVQITYNNMSGRSTEERGPSYIAAFREEHNQLTNVDAEETRNKLEEKQKILENAFITDFIAELSEKVNHAKDEIDAINNELKDLPFGQDIYTFKPKERADKASFFRIKNKIYDTHFGLDQSYSELITDDVELQQDIQDFMYTILNDSDEKEYADYRYYYSYDMEITNRIGTMNIKTDLSAKQGSASNGEKQTPYYIILAASLMQCYPKRTACARLAFIDEAFAALSQERIEQMVKYFEQNGFQIMYAAPPEKIKSIGSYIDSTVSLVETGRYTNVVEGLVDEFLDE